MQNLRFNFHHFLGVFPLNHPREFGSLVILIDDGIFSGLIKVFFIYSLAQRPSGA